MVEVDQVEHALDDGQCRRRSWRRRCTANTDGQARPTRTSGHGVHRARRQPGDAGVVGDQVRVPVDRDARACRALTVGHVAAGGAGDERAHRLDGARGRDDRAPPPASTESSTVMRSVSGRAIGTVSSAVRSSTWTQRGTGLGVLGALRVDDDPVASPEAVDGVADRAAGPHQVGRGEHEREDLTGVVDAAASRDTLRRATGGEQAVDRGVLEAAQQLGDGLVDPVDAGDRDGAGDDADLVGGVARVVRLPQRVRAPPAAHVLVEDGHEVDRLARGTALRRRRTATSAGCRSRRRTRPGRSSSSALERGSTVLDARRRRRTASGSGRDRRRAGAPRRAAASRRSGRAA